jgi:hypothetical protein
MVSPEPGAWLRILPWPQDNLLLSTPMVDLTRFPPAPTQLRLSSMTSIALRSRTKPTTGFPGRLLYREVGECILDRCSKSEESTCDRGTFRNSSARHGSGLPSEPAAYGEAPGGVLSIEAIHTTLSYPLLLRREALLCRPGYVRPAGGGSRVVPSVGKRMAVSEFPSKVESMVKSCFISFALGVFASQV